MLKNTTANTYTVTCYFTVPSQCNKENRPEQKNYYDIQKNYVLLIKFKKLLKTIWP